MLLSRKAGYKTTWSTLSILVKNYVDVDVYMCECATSDTYTERKLKAKNLHNQILREVIFE